MSASAQEVISALNNEIEDLYLEVEELHSETAMLQGIIAGSYAYFFSRIAEGHQSQQGLTPEVCEGIILDSLKRLLSTQNRFDYPLVQDIEAALAKMPGTANLADYVAKASKEPRDSL